MKYCLIIISIIISFICQGQKYNFKNFDREDVQAKYIYGFVQDTNGVLYAATSKGLLVYDGVKFELVDKYTHLKDDFVSNVYIDKKNNLWLSYYDNGLTRIRDGFYGITVKHFDSQQIKSLTEEDDNITIITSDYKKGVLNLKTNSFDYSINELSRLKIREIIKLNNGKEVYLCQEGIYYKIKNTIKLIPITEYEYIRELKANKKSNTFTFELNDKIYIYQYKDKLRLINTIDLDKIGINTKITDMVFLKDKLILATLGQGICKIKFIDQRLQAYNYITYNKKNGLLSDFVQSLFYDKEKNIWIGYYGEGISVFTPKLTLWYDEETGLADQNVLCVTNYKGKLAIGTNKGFSIITTNNIENYNKSTGFYDDKIKSLLTQNNRLWIGTESEGLFYMEDEKIKPFKFNNKEYQPRTINHILYSDNKLYLGTNTGLYIKSFTDGKELHIGTNEGLVHNVIEYMYIDSEGKFWFASPVSPIYSYKDGEFTLHKDIEGYESFELSQVFETKNKDIVFTTMGDGVFIYKDGKFTNYNIQNSNIFSNYVYFVVEDINHNIWLGHKNGLSRLDVENRTFDKFDKKDNPLLNGVNITSYQLSADNKLWIGTENGLVKINSGELSSNDYYPTLNYKGVSVNDSIVLKEPEIELSYSDYQLEFKFQAVCLTNPKDLNYQYKLEGFDKQWNTIPYDKLTAKYQSIIDGEYVFRLKLCLKDSCDEKEIKIKIIINKPFWKTTLAMILFAVLIIGIFLGVMYLINARRIRLMRILELKVQRRTLELSKANRIVEQKNNSLKKINEKVLKQHQDLELKNTEIDESIRYAKRIQKAFIIKDAYSEWRSLFEKTVMLNKPRDIVSGDFYWGSKINEHIYLAVGDCTGHGVPGAMLSMLGVAFLDEIIQYNEIKETKDVLCKLREKIIKELVHEEDEFAMKEGMDLILIRINTETRELQYSGANNSLYLVRKQSEQCKTLQECRNVQVGDYALAEIKADKQPIGFIHQLKPFTSKTIQLKKGDTIYMTTDGYADQFGGKYYKKFMAKRLKPMLIDIHQKTEKEQYKILYNTFMNWKGEGDQIDDVLIAGMTIK